MDAEHKISIVLQFTVSMSADFMLDGMTNGILYSTEVTSAGRVLSETIR